MDHSVDSTKKKFLFVANSSYGHIFPAIRLAHLLQAEGHEILFVAAKEYEQILILNGINCLGVGNSPNPFLSTVDWYVEQVILDQVRILNQIIHSFQPDRLVTSPLVMSSFIMAEDHDLHTTVIGYCEYLFPGSREGKFSPKQWRLESLTGYYNTARAALGKSPIEADANNTPLIGDCYLQQSTPAFDEYMVLPDQVKHIGSLYWDPPYNNIALDQFLQKAEANQRPVWYVQIGRLFENAPKWNQLHEALQALPANFVIDIGRADYLADHTNLAENLSFQRFVTFGSIKDRVAGIICSGQATSVVAGILHTKPILCMPHTDDAKELSQRVVKQNIGLAIFNNVEINTKTLSQALDKLSSPQILNNLQYWQQQFQEYQSQILPAVLESASTSTKV